MRRMKILYKIISFTNLDKFILCFGIMLFVSAAVLTAVEPDIERYGDGLWYCFVSCTTIGYGDFVAETALGRMIIAILTLYEILIIAFVPAVAVNYYSEISKLESNDSLVEFMDKLENLEKLSSEELAELSAQVRKKRKDVKRLRESRENKIRAVKYDAKNPEKPVETEEVNLNDKENR